MAEFKITDLTAAERQQITGYKRQVSTLADKLAIVKTTASDLAPKIMKQFKTLAAKYDALDFVGFTRLYDDTIPLNADPAKDGSNKGYKVHKTYVALDYMRRVLRQSDATAKRAAAKAAGTGGQGRVSAATDELARMLKTVLQVVKAADVAILFDAVAKEFDLKERAIARLKTRIENTKPLIDLSRIRPVDIRPDNVIHMDRAPVVVDVPAAAAAAMRGRGRAARRQHRVAA